MRRGAAAPLRPGGRSPVRSLLTQAEGASADGGGGAADGAAHGAGDDGGSDPFQRLALFSLDAPSGEPRQSLVAALEMLSGVVPAIGGSAREAEALPGDALKAMMRARLSEHREQLADLLASLDDLDDLDDLDEAAASARPVGPGLRGAARRPVAGADTNGGGAIGAEEPATRTVEAPGAPRWQTDRPEEEPPRAQTSPDETPASVTRAWRQAVAVLLREECKALERALA